MNETVKTTLKLAGESFVLPGSSLLIEGKLGKGALHLGASVLGFCAFGLPAAVLVGASSFYQSMKATPAAAGAPDVANKYRAGLAGTVRDGVAEGLTLEEIKAGVGEDVEDAYFEASAKAQKPVGGDAPARPAPDLGDMRAAGAAA